VSGLIWTYIEILKIYENYAGSWLGQMFTFKMHGIKLLLSGTGHFYRFLEFAQYCANRHRPLPWPFFLRRGKNVWGPFWACNLDPQMRKRSHSHILQNITHGSKMYRETPVRDLLGESGPRVMFRKIWLWDLLRICGSRLQTKMEKNGQKERKNLKNPVKSICPTSPLFKKRVREVPKVVFLSRFAQHACCYCFSCGFHCCCILWFPLFVFYYRR